MIRRPGHVANAPYPFAAQATAAQPGTDLGAGWDLARAAGNVVAHGGDEALFRNALAAGLAASGPRRQLTDEAIYDLVASAGWRSGALTLRSDALRRTSASTQRGRRAGLKSRGAAAALALHPGSLDEFVARQQVDPLWWPGRAAAHGYVLSVGGFAGLGGAWVTPPAVGFSTVVPGLFALRTGEDWWQLECDVFCSALRRLDPINGTRPGVPRPDENAAARIVFPDASYLAWICVVDES